MNIRISQNFNLIKKVALFTNLNEGELTEILENSQISNCKKGESLFSTEEGVLYFHIVLSGTVKTFISDIDGSETVLQIINCGNFINDAFADIFQTNAQAAEDCTILSIPIRKFREFVKNNLKLASTFLAEITKRNAELLDQLTRLKITNSKQKLGQFLLGMAFENNGNKSREVELKCDKSVIASYLGMNPETLSRNLQRLKDDGEISVTKNKITLLKDSSLCNYCNNKIAMKCDQHKASFCTS